MYLFVQIVHHKKGWKTKSINYLSQQQQRALYVPNKCRPPFWDLFTNMFQSRIFIKEYFKFIRNQNKLHFKFIVNKVFLATLFSFSFNKHSVYEVLCSIYLLAYIPLHSKYVLLQCTKYWCYLKSLLNTSRSANFKIVNKGIH